MPLWTISKRNNAGKTWRRMLLTVCPSPVNRRKTSWSVRNFSPTMSRPRSPAGAMSWNIYPCTWRKAVLCRGSERLGHKRQYGRCTVTESDRADARYVVALYKRNRKLRQLEWCPWAIRDLVAYAPGPFSNGSRWSILLYSCKLPRSRLAGYAPLWNNICFLHVYHLVSRVCILPGG